MASRTLPTTRRYIIGPTSEAKLRRVHTYFKDAFPTVDRPAGRMVGLYLSASQALACGVGNKPTTQDFYGKDYAEAMALAEAFVSKHLPDYHI